MTFGEMNSVPDTVLGTVNLGVTSHRSQRTWARTSTDRGDLGGPPQVGAALDLGKSVNPNNQMNMVLLF